MTYRFHPAAEAEHLGQIAFYESRRKGLGGRYRDHFSEDSLMAACAAGNVLLVEALLERGADPENTDHYGCNALHWAMRTAFDDPKFAKGPFPALYERVAPACIDVKAGERLVRIDRHQSEYLLLQTLWALLKDRFTSPHRGPGGAFDSQSVLEAWEHLPGSVLRAERNRRQHVSGVLARNELNRDYAYNRALFLRVSHGFYLLSPSLELRIREGEGEAWRPLASILNMSLVKEFTIEHYKPALGRYHNVSGLPSRPVRLPHEGAEITDRGAQATKIDAPREQEVGKGKAKDELEASDGPRWGTPAARMREMMRLQRRIDELRKQKKGD